MANDNIRVYELNGLSFVLSEGGVSINGGPVLPHNYRFSYFTVQGEVRTIETVRKHSRACRYDSVSEPVHSLTVEEYAAKRNELRKQDDYGDWVSLEAEYEFRKFESSYRAVMEDVEDRTAKAFAKTSLNYDVSDVPPYCAPCRLEGADVTSPNFALFNYQPNRLDLCEKIAAEYGFSREEVPGKDPLKWHVPEHSHKDLQFLKIGGKYATGDKRLAWISGAVGTLAECNARHQKNVAILRAFWAVNAALLAPPKLTSENLAEIRTQVIVAIGALSKVSATAKTSNHKQEASRCLANLLGYVESILTESTSATSPTVAGREG